MGILRTVCGGAMALFASQFLGCGSMYAPTLEDLSRRAAFDLDCPEPHLQKTELGGDTYGVSGCGRRATYVSTCNGQPGHLGTTCKWVMNNEQPDPRAAGAPAVTPGSKAATEGGSAPASK